LLIKFFINCFNYLKNELKQIWFKELIVAVPPDLEAQFDQTQLKNSLYRLKIFSIITITFNALNWPVYILKIAEMTPILLRNLLLADLSLLFITILFFLLTDYFSKKGKRSILWFLCYALIISYYLINFSTILSSELFLALQLFFTCTFFYTFIPDFKPKIFISFLLLWYLSIEGLFLYNDYSFEVGGVQVFILNIFMIALVIKILHYNSKVKTFINTFRISALNEKLEALATTDELTKLNNRRSFLEYMDTIWTLSRRLQTPVNVLMIDVDYFKKYNDSLGHLEGDKALIAIAQCMKDKIKRDTDLVARFGGEEFVCLLPFLEKDDALIIAKNLVQSVENMMLPHPMSEHSKYVTISVGMASTTPDNHNSQTKLLDEADKALYIAKESGRNRVVAN